MKSYVRLANISLLAILLANLLLPPGAVHRILLECEPQCLGGSIGLAAPLAGALIAYDDTSDTADAFEANQAEFWTWAWGAGNYSNENSCITIDRIDPPSPEDIGIRTLTAYSTNNGVLQTVGTAEMVTSATFNLVTETFLQEDSENNLSISTTVTTWVISGRITKADSHTRAVLCVVSEIAAVDVNHPSSSQTVFTLTPLNVTRDVASATAMAYGISQVCAGEVLGGSAFAGGGIYPCIADLPKEQQSCECQCAMDRASCENGCRVVLKGTIMGTSIGIGVGIGVCLLACLLSGGSFCLSCFILFGKSIAKAFAVGWMLYQACLAACTVNYEVCLSSCE